MNSSIKREVFTLKKDNSTIEYYEWKKENLNNPTGIIQIAHGVIETPMAYEEFANHFANLGFVVIVNDISKSYLLKNRNKISFGEEETWKDQVHHLAELSELYSNKYPNTPFYIMGLSLGSFLVRTVLIDYPKIEYDGAILAGTGQQSMLELVIAGYIAKNQAKKYGNNSFTKLVDKLTFQAYNRYFKPNKTKIDWLCSNEDYLKEFLHDPNVCSGFTAGIFRELIFGMQYTVKLKNAKQMNTNIPVLFISGKYDPVGEFGKGVKKAYDTFKKVGMDTEISFKEGRHDIFHEKNKEETYDTIYGWMKNKKK